MRVILFISLLTSIAYAQSWTELFKTQSDNCSRFVVKQDNQLLVGLRGLNNSSIRATNIDSGESHYINLDLKGGFRDAVVFENHIYALTNTTLEIFSADTYEHLKSHKILDYHDYLYKQNAMGMGLYNRKLYIAHGRLGLAVYDIDTARTETLVELAKFQTKESMAVDVDIINDKVLILMDNFSIPKDPMAKPYFRGIVIFNPKTNKDEHYIRGIDPGAIALDINNDEFIISNHPILVRYSLKELLVNKKLKNRKPATKISGVSIGSYGRGKSYFQGDKIYMCIAERLGPSNYFRHGFEVPYSSLNWSK